jgi:hypothetical protein
MDMPNLVNINGKLFSEPHREAVSPEAIKITHTDESGRWEAKTSVITPYELTKWCSSPDITAWQRFLSRRSNLFRHEILRDL